VRYIEAVNDKDLIYGIMASLGEREYSVARLKALVSPFSMSDTSLRTILSRMSTQGLLSSEKRGKQAFYSFAEKGKGIGSNVSLAFCEPDWSGWNGRWWGFLYSLPSGEKALRHKLRTKLEGCRFVSFYPGCWIRPCREEERVVQKITGFCDGLKGRLIYMEFPEELSKEEVSTLWKLPLVNASFRSGIEVLDLSEKELDRADPAEAFRLKMEKGDEIVKILFGDPLLPPLYLPVDWAGSELRRRFALWNKRAAEASAPFTALK